MKFSLHKDFCVWLVSPSDGKVRKLRFSLLKAIGASFGLALVAGVFMYIAGDYTRVQITRARQHFSFRRVVSERDSLKQLNRALSESVKHLKSDKVRAINYERNIRERLDELSLLVDSAVSFGVVEERRAREQKVGLKKDAEEGGVGGAEVDYCVLGDAACVGQVLAYNWQPSEPKATIKPDFKGSAPMNRQDLVGILEGYIEMLRSVPIGLPCKGRVNSPFGMRISPFENRLRMHQGVDFGGKYGDPIKCTADGVVSDVRRTRNYGIVVDVVHSHKVRTRYAHLAKALVEEGQSLNRGQVIGLMGATGRTTGIHLHYEVLVNGRQKDPSKLVELGIKMAKLLAKISA
ncbi:MAG: M23 family metallopeptidase [Deltaproteobacteria bacterium]|nr:M23 family metallopeptidase [Deltaproteobacteria bacterium]